LVQTQREHIALLKAIGYSHWAIAGHYFKYALLVALLGTLLGTLLGFWLGSALAGVDQQFFQLSIPALSSSPESDGYGGLDERWRCHVRRDVRGQTKFEAATG
jgi:putative ABC transport system permease protein